MKVEKIIYIETVQVSATSWKKLGMEVSPEGNEYIDACYSYAQGKVSQILKAMHPEMLTDFNTGEQRPAPTTGEAKEEADREFEEFKINADKFLLTNPTEEQITQWLKNTGWFFAIQAKDYINQSKK